MRLPRLSIRILMIVVGMLALNFGMAQAVFAGDPAWWVIAMSMLGLVELEALLLVRGRRRLRPFWIGFLAVSALVMVSFLWAMAFPKSQGIKPIKDPRTGKVVATLHQSHPGSMMWALWNAYGERVESEFEARPVLKEWMEEGDESVHVVIDVLVMAAPHLLLPLAGGLLASGISRLMGIRRRSTAGPIATEAPEGAAGP